MRLIDADELIEQMEAEAEHMDDHIAKMFIYGAISEIKHAPTIEPERKTGRWYKPQGYPRDSYRFICDNCHDVAYFVTGNNGKKNKSDNPKCGYRYCPNCGADMRGEQP